jgi:thiosulfate/3-mercaptopyruvate sulfurtransferase
MQNIFKTLALLLALTLFTQCNSSENPILELNQEEVPASPSSEPWNESQLLDPAILAAAIEDPEQETPYIYSLFHGGIKDSKTFGPVSDKGNLNKLRKELEDLPRDAEVVIYCGCCPFKDCPNVRPGFAMLNEMGFTNHKLLNLATNLKVDWIEKGYPLGEE